MGVPRFLTGTLAGALTAPLFLLAACGDDDSVADPPVSPGPTSASPTGTPQRESAEHFIRRFYATERTMENTGNTSSYQHLTRRCTSCASLANEVARFYEHGGFVQWGGLVIESIRPYSSRGAKRTFAVKGQAKPTTYKSSSAASPSRLSGGLTTELVTISRVDSSWRVTGFAKLGGH